VAKALVARILMIAGSVPLDPAGKPTFNGTRIMAVRAMVAVAGLGFLEGTALGFRGDRLGEDEMGTRLGVSKPAARRALRAAVAMGWLTCTQQRAGSPSRYVLALPLPAQVADDALVHMELYSLLGNTDLMAAALKADDEVDETQRIELAETYDVTRALRVLLTAAHPAWSYGTASKVADRAGAFDTQDPSLPALSHRDFFVLLAAAARVDAASLGMTERSVRASRKNLKLAGIGADLPGSLTQQLATYASRSGARKRSDEAWAVRNDDRRARTAAVRAQQTMKRTERRFTAIQARIIGDRITAAAMPAPVGGKPGSAFGPWLVQAQTIMRQVRIGTDRKGPSWAGPETLIHKELVRRAEAAGYAQAPALADAVLWESDAVRTVNRVLTVPIPPAIAGQPNGAFGPWLVQAREAVHTARESWTGSEEALHTELTVRGSEAGYTQPGSVADAILWVPAAA
jgi:hypothetical protein